MGVTAARFKAAIKVLEKERRLGRARSSLTDGQGGWLVGGNCKEAPQECTAVDVVGWARVKVRVGGDHEA